MALSFYEKTLEMERKSLPTDHIDLANIYQRIENVKNV